VHFLWHGTAPMPSPAPMGFVLMPS
jgi:hypothetical protein